MIDERLVEQFAAWLEVPVRTVLRALDTRDPVQLRRLGLTPDHPEQQIAALIA